MNEWDMSEMDAEFERELAEFFSEDGMPKREDGWFTISDVAFATKKSYDGARWVIEQRYNSGKLDMVNFKRRRYYRIKKDGGDGTETERKT